MSKKRKLAVGLVLAVLVLTAAGLAIATTREQGVLVRTEEVQRRDLVAVVTASGVIQPTRKVEISADISGRVIELAVEEGQRVQRGDLLLRIDPTAYEAAVRRAEAAVAQARAQEALARANLLQAQNAAERAENLARSDILISSADLEQARTQASVSEAQFEAAGYAVQQAQASLSEAREALRKTTIVAPMAGQVTRLNIEEGETAIVGTMNNPGSLLLTVADMGEMEAAVEVDETDVPHISLGDSALVQIDAYPDQTFPGHVTQIGHSAIQGAAAMSGGEAQSVDYEVIITLDAPPTQLRPDLSATAEVITETRQNTLAVPIIAVTVRSSEGRMFRSDEDTPEALREGPAESDEVEGVFLLGEGTAQWMAVEVGIAGDRYFEVQSGLQGGETVIAGPYSTIRDLEDGDPVRVETEPATDNPNSLEEDR